MFFPTLAPAVQASVSQLVPTMSFIPVSVPHLADVMPGPEDNQVSCPEEPVVWSEDRILKK